MLLSCTAQVHVAAPPEPSEPREVVRGARGPSLKEIPVFAWGSLKFIPATATAKPQFRACCAFHGSGCTRSKTLVENPHRPGQGRPIGELVAWLDQGRHVSADDHKDCPTAMLSDRKKARDDFNTLPDSAEWRHLERPQADHEPGPEPDVVPAHPMPRAPR